MAIRIFNFKKKINLFLKNFAFKFAHRPSINKLKKQVKKSKIIPKKNIKKKKKILFNMIYGMYGELIYWEGTLAKALQLRGHDVNVLTCGKTLPICTSEYTIHKLHDDVTCKHCVDFSKEFLETAQIPNESYRKYITDERIDEIGNLVKKLTIKQCMSYIYHHIQVGVLTKNSTIRYFKGATNPDKKIYQEIAQAELQSSIIAVDVAINVFKKEKPDILITTHLGYSSWGGFAEYMRNKGVRLVYPGGGYKKGLIGFDFNIKGDTDKKFKKYFEEYRKKNYLSNKEDSELEEFLNKRFGGKEGDTATYGYEDKEVKDIFKLKKNKLTYGMFPNVAWDSSLLIVNMAFNNVYDWIIYTIDQFIKNPDYQLLIKIHPAEIINKSENTIHDFIKNYYKTIPENIKIIPLGTKISPYKLFSLIDVGLIYNGTTGLEMAIKGLPVIVAGQARYGRKGFTTDIKTIEDYNKALFKKLPKLKTNQIKLARLYAYFYFIKGFLPFNYVQRSHFFNLRFNLKSFDELAEGKDEVLDKICDYITKDDILKLIT